MTASDIVWYTITITFEDADAPTTTTRQRLSRAELRSVIADTRPAARQRFADAVYHKWRRDPDAKGLDTEGGLLFAQLSFSPDEEEDPDDTLFN